MKNSGSQFALPFRLVSGEGGPAAAGVVRECLVLSLDQVIVTSAIVLSKAKAFIHLPLLAGLRAEPVDAGIPFQQVDDDQHRRRWL